MYKKVFFIAAFLLMSSAQAPRKRVKQLPVLPCLPKAMCASPSSSRCASPVSSRRSSSSSSQRSMLSPYSFDFAGDTVTGSSTDMSPNSPPHLHKDPLPSRSRGHKNMAEVSDIYEPHSAKGRGRKTSSSDEDDVVAQLFKAGGYDSDMEVGAPRSLSPASRAHRDEMAQLRVEMHAEHGRKVLNSQGTPRSRAEIVQMRREMNQHNGRSARGPVAAPAPARRSPHDVPWVLEDYNE